MKRTTVLAGLGLVVVLGGGCRYWEAFTRPPQRSPIYATAQSRPCSWLPEARDQSRLRAVAVRDKVRQLLLPALHAAELDAWLLVERDSQRDPMLDSLGLGEPGDKLVLFIGDDGKLRAFAFGTPLVMPVLSASGLFEQVSALTPGAVADTLARFRPRRIGINYSARVPFADGVATGSRQFAAWLAGREYAGRFRSAEPLAIAWRAARTADEIELARQGARCAAEIAERTVAGALIETGQTTAAELAWRAAADLRAAQLECLSLPRVSVVKLADSARLSWPWAGANTDTSIDEGDLVHVALELRYAGMAAAVERTGYVRKRWESDIPSALRTAFEAVIQVRNGLAPLFRHGLSGQQLATDAAAWAEQRGLTVELLAHPVGYTARDAGTLVPAGVGPYDMAAGLAERPLQQGELQSLGFRVTVPLAGGRRLTWSAADTGVVGFGGLDFLVPPAGDLVQ
ncbi:MAG: M24 family metallopeptidase [Deltaproteobacteria bacterium]|nr:M24 family metallopeptidase [Deltaproteobacteria bacterium]